MPGRILIKRLLKAEKTTHGIVLPQQSREQSQIGEAVAIGADVVDVRQGQVVFFSLFAARPMFAFSPEEDAYVWVKMQDVHGILEQESAPVVTNGAAIDAVPA